MRREQDQVAFDVFRSSVSEYTSPLKTAAFAAGRRPFAMVAVLENARRVMRPMQKLLFALAALLVVSGCTMERPRGIINDLSVRPEFDSGYALVAVDGKPVDRPGHGEATTAPPLASVDAGEHKLTLQPKLRDSKDPTLQKEVTITAKIEPNKKYRFDKQNDRVTLVEDF
jgi:hypothetical protein